MGALKKKKQPRRRLPPMPDISWETFLARYTAILFAARDWVEEVAKIAAKSGEDPWVTTPMIAQHLASNRPAAYVKTFGTDDPYELKEWRILSILRNASHLGCWSALGLISRHGRGVTVKDRRAKLKVVK